jgi:hypothetical protein
MKGRPDPVQVSEPHRPNLRQVTSWQAHICGEGPGEELLIGIVFFDRNDKPIAETHMTLKGACELLDTIAEVIGVFREKLGEVNH